jgi:hypothetical protein
MRYRSNNGYFSYEEAVKAYEETYKEAM